MSGIHGPCSRALFFAIFVVGTCELRAADSVAIDVQVSADPTDEPQIRLLDNISEVFRGSIAYKLYSLDFDVLQDQLAANYLVSVQIQPVQKCSWQVNCTWSRGNISRQCWNGGAPLYYCGPKDNLSAKNHADCLSGLIDFTTDRPQSGKGCAPETPERVALASCLSYDFKDDSWVPQVRRATRNVLSQIEVHLDKEFEKFGFDVEVQDPFVCGQETLSRPNQEFDLLILGSVQEKKVYDEVYVIFSAIGHNDNVSPDLRQKINGPTEDIPKSTFVEDISNAIITYMHSRLN